MKSVKYKKILFLGLFFLAISLIITWPLITCFDTCIPDRFDGLLIAWIHAWVIHHPFNLDSNIFFSYQNTLAFSDFHWLSAMIVSPLSIFTDSAIVYYNSSQLLGFALTGLSTYILSKFLSKSDKIGFLISFIYTFSSIHLNYLTHLQLFNLWPIILTIYFFVSKKNKLFILFYFLSTLNSPLNFFFLMLSISGCVLLRTDKIKSIGLFITALFFSSFVFMPYYLVSKQNHYVRPITDAIHFSLKWMDLFNVGPTSKLSLVLPATSSGTPGFPGVSIFILLIYYCHDLIAKKKFIELPEKIFAMSGLSALILAFGPAFHVLENTIHIWKIPAIPLPYLALYYLLPGFSGFRTPSRWILLGYFLLTLAIGIRFKNKFNKLAIFVLCLLTFVEINLPMTFAKIPAIREFPPEQVWLKDHRIGESIIQFPIYRWDDTPQFGEETLREYYSTIHWHPMYNGFSGFSSKEWERDVKWLQKKFPSSETISFLKNKKIKLVVASRHFESRIKEYNQLELVAEFPKSLVYEIK